MKDNFKYYRPITVGELIKVLGKYPKGMRVALSSDSEGNRYSYLPNKEFIAADVYMPLNEWSDDPLNCDEADDNERCKCIVLFPCD